MIADDRIVRPACGGAAGRRRDVRRGRLRLAYTHRAKKSTLSPQVLLCLTSHGAKHWGLYLDGVSGPFVDSVNWRMLSCPAYEKSIGGGCPAPTHHPPRGSRSAPAPSVCAVLRPPTGRPAGPLRALCRRDAPASVAGLCSLRAGAGLGL